MDYKNEFNRWMSKCLVQDLMDELKYMDKKAVEDAFYRDLAFGTGELRGTIGAGTNQQYECLRGRQGEPGLSKYLLEHYSSPSVVISYDIRIKSDVFAKIAAGVPAANGIQVVSTA